MKRKERKFKVPLHNFYSCPCIVGHPCTCKVVPEISWEKLDRWEKEYDARPEMKMPFMHWARLRRFKEQRIRKAQWKARRQRP